MGTLLKILRRIALSIIILVALLFIASYSMIASETGTRWLVNNLVKLSNNTIAVSELSGTFLSPLVIGNLTYTNCDTFISIDSLKSKWQLKSLFNKTLNIDNISAKQVTVNLGETCDQSPNQPPTLPDRIDLPIDIILQALNVDKLIINQDKKTHVASNIKLNTLIKNNQLNFELVNLDYLTLNIHTNFTTELTKPFQTDGSLRWLYILDKQKFKGDLDLNGDIENIILSHVLSSPYLATTNLSIKNPLEDFTFDSITNVKQADLAINKKQTVIIYNAILNASGNIEEVNYQLNSNIDTSVINEITLSSAGKITPEFITISPLSIQHKQANLSANGEVNLKNGIQATLRIIGSQLDPSVINKDYPGKLQLDSLITFKQNNTKNYLNASINKLNGVLREYPVDASGKFQSDLKQTKLDNINISIGENTLHGSGLIDKTLDLNIKVNAPKIEQLTPKAQGQLQGDIIIKGLIEQPTIQANLTSTYMSYDDNVSIKNAAIDASLDNTTERSVNAKLSIEELIANQNTINDVAIDVNGSLEKHQIKSKLSSEYATLSLQAFGSYDETTQSWNSIDNQLSITDSHIGNWISKNPANITLSTNSQTINKLCLFQNKESSCLTYSNDINNNQSIEFDLNQFSLEHTKNVTNEYARSLGTLSGKASLAKNHNDAWMGNAILYVDRLIISPTKELEIKEDIVFDEVKASLKIGESSDFKLNFSSNYGHGDTTLNISSSNGFTKNHINDGIINLSLPDLTFLSAYIGDTTIKQGNALFNIQLTGPIDNLKIAGDGSINNLSFYTPALGIEYNDSQFTLQADDFSKVIIQGKLSSTDGSLGLNGWLSFAELNNIQYQANIIGSNFPVIDTINIKSSVSPDLIISGNQQQVDINGKLHIPTLHVILKELPPGIISVSDDEVIINDTTNIEQKESFKTQGTIELSIGDDADFIGYGLKTDLSGKLKIILIHDQQPVAHGALNMNNAAYSKFGQTLDINRGKFIFAGPLDAPSLDVQIQRITDEVTVSMLITGKANDPSTQLTSNPPLSEANKLSYLLTGRGVNELNNSEGSNLSNAALTLGLDRSSSAVQEIGTKFGFDNVSIEAGDDGLQSTSLLLGKYLSPKLYISYAKNLFSSLGAIQINYSLTNNISVEVESGTQQTVDLIYSISTD